MNNDWMTAKEIAAYLQIHHSTVLKYAKRGDLPAYKLTQGNRVTWRFSRSKVDEFLKSRTNEYFKSKGVIVEPASAADETRRIH